MQQARSDLWRALLPMTTILYRRRINEGHLLHILLIYLLCMFVLQ